MILQKLETWTASHLTKGTVMEPNYSLPLNVAVITLQVIVLNHGWMDSPSLSLSLTFCFVGVGWWQRSPPSGTFIWGVLHALTYLLMKQISHSILTTFSCCMKPSSLSLSLCPSSLLLILLEASSTHITFGSLFNMLMT